MDRESIMRKIRACLRLSKSSNANEAAAALRQAKKLMELAGIADDDIGSVYIDESDTEVSAMKPASWESLLVYVIGEAFGCRYFYKSKLDAAWKRKPLIVFVGLHHRAEVASYTFKVMRRQCRRARAEYLKTLKRFGRKNKVQKADVFCLHWADEVTDQIQKFAMPQEEADAIEKHLATAHELVPHTTRKTEQRDQDWQSAAEGRRAGAKAVLNHGVGADQVPALPGAEA